MHTCPQQNSIPLYRQIAILVNAIQKALKNEEVEFANAYINRISKLVDANIGNELESVKIVFDSMESTVTELKFYAEVKYYRTIPYDENDFSYSVYIVSVKPSFLNVFDITVEGNELKYPGMSCSVKECVSAIFDTALRIQVTI